MTNLKINSLSSTNLNTLSVYNRVVLTRTTTSTDILDLARLDNSDVIREAYSSNPIIKDLNKLFNSNDLAFVMGAASNINATSTQLQKAIVSDSVLVRLNAARNPSADESVLKTGLTDNQPHVVYDACASNPSITSTLIFYILATYSRQKKDLYELPKSKNISSEEILDYLVSCENSSECKRSNYENVAYALSYILGLPNITDESLVKIRAISMLRDDFYNISLDSPNATESFLIGFFDKDANGEYLYSDNDRHSACNHENANTALFKLVTESSDRDCQLLITKHKNFKDISQLILDATSSKELIVLAKNPNILSSELQSILDISVEDNWTEEEVEKLEISIFGNPSSQEVVSGLLKTREYTTLFYLALAKSKLSSEFILTELLELPFIDINHDEILSEILVNPNCTASILRKVAVKFNRFPKNFLNSPAITEELLVELYHIDRRGYVKVLPYLKSIDDKIMLDIISSITSNYLNFHSSYIDFCLICENIANSPYISEEILLELTKLENFYVKGGCAKSKLMLCPSFSFIAIDKYYELNMFPKTPSLDSNSEFSIIKNIKSTGSQLLNNVTIAFSSISENKFVTPDILIKLLEGNDISSLAAVKSKYATYEVLKAGLESKFITVRKAVVEKANSEHLTAIKHLALENSDVNISALAAKSINFNIHMQYKIITTKNDFAKVSMINNVRSKLDLLVLAIALKDASLKVVNAAAIYEEKLC